jgi:hypothetical protein
LALRACRIGASDPLDGSSARCVPRAFSGSMMFYLVRRRVIEP